MIEYIVSHSEDLVPLFLVLASICAFAFAQWTRYRYLCRCNVPFRVRWSLDPVPAGNIRFGTYLRWRIREEEQAITVHTQCACFVHVLSSYFTLVFSTLLFFVVHHGWVAGVPFTGVVIGCELFVFIVVCGWGLQDRPYLRLGYIVAVCGGCAYALIHYSDLPVPPEYTDTRVHAISTLCVSVPLGIGLTALYHLPFEAMACIAKIMIVRGWQRSHALFVMITGIILMLWCLLPLTLEVYHQVHDIAPNTL